MLTDQELIARLRAQVEANKARFKALGEDLKLLKVRSDNLNKVMDRLKQIINK